MIGLRADPLKKKRRKKKNLCIFSFYAILQGKLEFSYSTEIYKTNLYLYSTKFIHKLGGSLFQLQVWSTRRLLCVSKPHISGHFMVSFIPQLSGMFQGSEEGEKSSKIDTLLIYEGSKEKIQNGQWSHVVIKNTEIESVNI